MLNNNDTTTRKNTVKMTALVAALMAAAGCSKTSEAPSATDKPPETAKVSESAKPAPDTAPAKEEAVEELRDGDYKKLEALVGDWSGTGSLEVGGNKLGVTSKFSCRVARGGVALLCEHDGEIENMGPMIETALMGFDPVAKKFHWYNVNTMGETHDHTGQWTSESRVEWVFESDQGGKPFVESISMDLADGALSFRSEAKLDGQRQALFEGKMTK